MMARVGILTDTTNCLPQDLILQYGINVVPVSLILDGKVYRDQIDITPAEFWQKFKKLSEVPTTSAPTPAEFEQAFTDLSRTAESIICILVSRILSSTQNSAELGRQAFLEKNPAAKVEIIDSKCAAGALGFVVLEAARAAQAGRNFGEINELVRGMLPRVTYLTALETMKYLIKGGRAPRLAAIGDLLGVKPIISNNKDTGEVDSVGRGRGKQKTFQKLVDMVSDYADAAKPLHMMVHFTTSLKDGEKLRDLVTARYKCRELYLTPYTPVMAAHTGPVVSLAFYSE
jgi:DegV family protein with EDD domain